MRAAVLSLALVPFVITLSLIACQAPLAPTRPKDVARATFRVEVDIRVDGSPVGLGEGTMTSFGTAWVVFNEPHRSYLITAGHVCKRALMRTEDAVGGADMAAALGIDLAKHEFLRVKAEYTLRGQDSSEYRADMYARSDDPDLCLLVTGAPVGPALGIAGSDPSYDEPVMYVGAPAMSYGDGAAPVLRGTYAGGNMVTTPLAGGASGSALLSSRGVIGVLTAVNRGFANVGYFVTRARLLDFLRDNRLPL